MIPAAPSGELPEGAVLLTGVVLLSQKGESEDKMELQIVVRTGRGTVTDGRRFNDQVGIVWRIPRFNVGWQAVTYKRQRYQLFGGVRTPYFICLNNPIKGRS